ncbi:MAG: hypothetical protein JWN70_725 [Planctomycetaceae bacterium]|nr:hypothetical protein [Planctomycetaceae bacterium]
MFLRSYLAACRCFPERIELDVFPPNLEVYSMVKSRLASFLAVGVVMFLSASMALAQNQGQGNRGAGGGGRGGFGGPRVGGVMGLLNNEEVQKELALDDATKASVKKVTDAAGEEARKELGAGGGFGDFANLSADERRAKFAEMQAKGAEVQAKITAKYQPQVKEVLTPAQFERAQQIYWQSNTVRALSDPDLVKALDVTKEQTDKIAAVSKEYEEKQRGLFGRGAGGGAGGAGGGEGNREKMVELSKERDTKVTDVLTADQKTKFATLKGKEFDVSKLRGGFGGGRGGRGGRPAGAAGRPETEKKAE